MQNRTDWPGGANAGIRLLGMITSPFVILAYLIFIACAYVFAALALALWLIWLIGAGCVAVVKWVK